MGDLQKIEHLRDRIKNELAAMVLCCKHCEGEQKGKCVDAQKKIFDLLDDTGWEDYHDKATKLLMQDEGFRDRLYRCTSGKQTIGFGFNVDDNTLTYEQALFILESQVCEYDKELKNALSCYVFLSDPRKIVLINMRHAIGMTGLLRFHNMLNALTNNDFKRAAVELRDSEFWRSKTHNRAERLALILELNTLETGEA